MLYAVLKTLHVLSIIVWVGGMAFTLFFLRPAVAQLEPPVRLRLMLDVLGRFFGAVLAMVAMTLATGAWMMADYAGRAAGSGAGVHMPWSWSLMAALGVLMAAIFGHIRYVLFARLRRAVASSTWVDGGAAMASIRVWVRVNLALGLLVVVVVLLTGQ
jgi:uncharacterized membrane protein